MRLTVGGVAPVRFGHAERVEHRLRAQPARRQRRPRSRRAAPSSCAERERHAVHRRLGEVVEERDAVVGRVVLVGAVGHLDDQAAGLLDQQRQREVARDRVRVDAEAERAQPDRRGRTPRPSCSTPSWSRPRCRSRARAARPARASMRATSARTCVGHEVIDLRPRCRGRPRRRRARRSPRSSPAGPSPSAARASCGRCSRRSRRPRRAPPRSRARPRASRPRPARPSLPTLKSSPEPRPRDVGQDPLDVGR